MHISGSIHICICMYIYNVLVRNEVMDRGRGIQDRTGNCGVVGEECKKGIDGPESERENNLRVTLVGLLVMMMISFIITLGEIM